MPMDSALYEHDKEADVPDPDEIPVRDRAVITQPYDLAVQALIHQIENKTIFLRPTFQRGYVWPNATASKLIESIILNVPIPPCYLSQNDDFELDVIDGQQRLTSIHRFSENQFALSGLHVLNDLNGLRFHQLPRKTQRKIENHTIRCVVITNESHPDIKFEVFERLNSNTVPLNAQELRNCIYRGPFNDLLKTLAIDKRWLAILGRKSPDKRMRDEELILRFFSFYISGIENYRTPLKSWLNETAEMGRGFTPEKINDLSKVWESTIENCLTWFDRDECFRRIGSKSINRALFDLVCNEASGITNENALIIRDSVRHNYYKLCEYEEFKDLISRSVDHKRRTQRRFEICTDKIREAL